MPRKPISFELDFMIKDIFPRFTVKQFDDVSFNIKPKNQGLDYNTTGMIGKIFVGVNNDMFMQTTGITVSNNNINILLDKNMLQKSGRAYAEVELTDNAGTITSSSFIFDIDPKIGEGGMIPGEYEGFVEKYERLISEFKSQVNLTINNCNNKVNTTINNCNTNVDNKLNTVDGLINTKVLDFEKRFNSLTSKQQQDAEVIDARDNEVSLKARLDRDIEKAKQVYVNVEGSNISTDSSSGYAKDVEILGNTIQDASNLADIRSVGDIVEGQELYEIPVLSCGKNLFNGELELGTISSSTGVDAESSTNIRSKNFIIVGGNKQYIISIPSNLNIDVYYYDANKTYIKNNGVLNDKNIIITTPNNCRYIRIRIGNSDTNLTVQLEEGTQATPYEPYVEDKLTILSPVQLEKVGDVADRIIEKDGVWGVEKNIRTVDFDGSEGWRDFTISSGSVNIVTLVINDNANDTKVVMCDKFKYLPSNEDEEHIRLANDKEHIRVFFNKDKGSSLTEWKSWLNTNPIHVKYATNSPQFIPLPHSQQIKLRTFANKTNISFLTEIEGTIKAQVPKSLGATVNTHTEQISNLNKELDRVKKLEESTVSTVETESDFTTVEATSNGYFEDVKLEGKTLVNLCGGKTNLFSSDRRDNPFINDDSVTKFIARCEPNKTYTIIKSKPTNRFIVKQTDKLEVGNKAYYLYGLDDNSTDTFITVRTKDNANFLWIYIQNEIIDCDVLVLEGDHTQHPPSYFEGLKSVGENTDEIVVSSAGEYVDINGFVQGAFSSSDTFVEHAERLRYENFILCKDLSKTSIKVPNGIVAEIRFYNNSKEYISNQFWVANGDIVNIPNNCYYLRFSVKKQTGGTIGVRDLTYFKIVVNSDKKRLLYYNNETQTWEKPILREWDSIEKHSDGKYYYHQRSGEVVLNGNEFWELRPQSDSQDVIAFNGSGLTTSSNVLGVVCDKFPTIEAFGEGANFENVFIATSMRMQIRVLKSRLTTQDVAGFKQWLQANNVTVVYQLAQEKVYECTNIDLITYANETNYMVDCGAIVPRSTLKVHNNISNVVSLLQKKVSLLESNITSYMITQNRLMLASRYNADNVTFKVDYPSMMSEREVEIDYDLFKLIQDNIIVGPENYDVDKMLEIMDLYAMIGFITWEMWDYLYEVIDSQITPVIEDLEGTPEI